MLYDIVQNVQRSHCNEAVRFLCTWIDINKQNFLRL